MEFPAKDTDFNENVNVWIVCSPSDTPQHSRDARLFPVVDLVYSKSVSLRDGETQFCRHDVTGHSVETTRPLRMGRRGEGTGPTHSTDRYRNDKILHVSTIRCRCRHLVGDYVTDLVDSPRRSLVGPSTLRLGLSD